VSGQGVPGHSIEDLELMEGVAKLGYSWEANDVLRFKGARELAVRLTRLFNQPQGTAEFAFVQDLIVDFDCEVRTFVVNGKPIQHARRYTAFAVPAAGIIIF
jgi:hypothetical protein